MAKLTPSEQAIVKEFQEHSITNRKPIKVTTVNIAGTKWVSILKDAQEIDPSLSAEQLQSKYGVEHPIFTQLNWEDAKATDSTVLEYWHWVIFWLAEEITEEHLQDNLHKLF